jgi:NAD dependent epimerase/dehydratase family enzyme
MSRIVNSKTGTVVITAAGIGYAGTQAAAEFLTNSQSISNLVKSLPKDWEKRNVQIVLHTSVINQIPSAPEVVASYCW